MSRVILAVYEGAQGLDVFGPAEVFAGAGRHLARGGYEVLVAAVGGGTVRATSGVGIAARELTRLRPRPGDTVLVVGGEENAVRAAVRSKALVAWVAGAARTVRRIGSVCSGAFVLAKAGLLDGHRAATHWSACSALAAFRPAVTVDPNAIFVQEGRLWTSAGVTTGIDMALAMVEEDHGRRVADALAARLVLYARRPGFQSQFSEALVAQGAASDPLPAVLEWARANLRGTMSASTFHRRCVDELGTTPAKLVEKLRLEHARTLLATTALGTKTVATRAGFGTPSRMARVFKRALGVAPSDYAVLHGRARDDAR